MNLFNSNNKKRYRKNTNDFHFYFKHFIKWILIILIVTIIFLIINNLFYNTLENEINDHIIKNPSTPPDILTMKPIINNLKNLSPDLKTLPNKISNEVQKLPVKLKNFSISDNKISNDINEIFNNLQNIKVDNTLDFELNL